MVYLLTGPSHVGKTLLAQRLMERYRHPYLSLDLLKMGFIRSGQTTLTPEEDDRLREYLWPIVRELIKTCLLYTSTWDFPSLPCTRPMSWRVRQILSI